MRVAIYVRVSTMDQEPENQLRELRQYADARGWTATEFVDRGVSAPQSSRRRRLTLAGLAAVVALALGVGAAVIVLTAHRKVLLVGDSITGQSAGAATADLQHEGYQVQVAAGPGTGLLDTKFDWLGMMRQLVARYQPDEIPLYRTRQVRQNLLLCIQHHLKYQARPLLDDCRRNQSRPRLPASYGLVNTHGPFSVTAMQCSK